VLRDRVHEFAVESGDDLNFKLLNLEPLNDLSAAERVEPWNDWNWILNIQLLRPVI
jgi:hypothetical protein